MYPVFLRRGPFSTRSGDAWLFCASVAISASVGLGPRAIRVGFKDVAHQEIFPSASFFKFQFFVSCRCACADLII